MTLGRHCSFIPPYLLQQLARSGLISANAAEETMRLDRELRARRSSGPQAARVTTDDGEAVRWRVHDAQQGTDLPGVPVRSEGDGAVGDQAADEAAAGITTTLDVFAQRFGRDSFDGEGAMVPVSVHYGRAYANAFWDGSHLVFGDGDGEVLIRFTASIDVLAHEFSHAVTEHTAGLVYQGQAGALNESMSDVFGAIVKQESLGQSAAEADWLVGAEIFGPGINARALRDMQDPGTAYDDPRLGKDPQPAHMDDFIVTEDDNGGVHLNSGIPNRAFVLAAQAIGGTSAQGAGQIWYSALTGGAVGSTADFAAFAQATIAAAGEHAEAVGEAWAAVGVGSSAPAGSPTPAPEGPPTDPAPSSGQPVVGVRRSGGFAGLVSESSVDLAGDDPRAPQLRELLARRPLAGVRRGDPHPDGFIYTFTTPDGEASVPEQHLTADLAAIADLVLRGDGGDR